MAWGNGVAELHTVRAIGMPVTDDGVLMFAAAAFAAATCAYGKSFPFWTTNFEAASPTSGV